MSGPKLVLSRLLSRRECIRLARMSDDPELRYELFEMARNWMALAMEEVHSADGPVAEAA